MSYTFDIVGISPVFNFMDRQSPDRIAVTSKAYLGSPECSLDAFMRSVDLLSEKPAWNWDEVMTAIVNFWLVNEERIRYWKTELAIARDDHLLVAYIAHVEALRHELEQLWIR
ncbi:MAG: hypothetical protein HC838_14360 [Spirulinaceae cyanobacterium RM2_2_10]|nr:hypothetical protein [Spirulinaceae cyanobacterium SM2_1_0]NJO20977.1 hypothetical protein [Spirulinaceae cyanobacterium RM2_2_10]